MSLKVTCERCNEELTEPGGLLFSPPINDWHVQKTHLCKTCWPVFVRQGITMPDKGESNPAVRVDSIPSHNSPPDDGLVHAQIDRISYKVVVNTYTGAEVRAWVHPPISDDHYLWLIVPGYDDLLVRDDVTVAVHYSGMRFYTTPKYITAG